ncbi:Pogo transposable element with KRAB domain [Stylophora pistillata]|uniref:Pogo transposable element with KRAB domain n=1 Tax=Stylophora pistillata TaxID=50429 RepID=A0A2B4R987_STYPI|nr:Pogo transposable element with KRAB domain [Stylophora pistillata]
MFTIPQLFLLHKLERVKSTDDEFKAKCVVASPINGWMNEELTVSWVKGVLAQFSFTRRMLVWNSFRCHVLDSVKQELDRTKIDPVIVPGGYSEYVQAPDVSWNKPFKAKVTEKYDEWMANGQHAFTAAGNMRAPPRREIVQWILEAWDDLDKEIIVNYFKSCALTLAVDGSEDELIHCLKPSQPCYSSLAQLKAVQQKLQQTMENDPFQDMTLSDVEDAAPMTTLLEDSDTEIQAD